jgi:soluble lytic murein transglycosylase-like protein
MTLSTIRLLMAAALIFLLCAGATAAHRGRRSKAHSKKHTASKSVAEANESDEDPRPDVQMRLKFIDGTDAIVEDAGENENGFWYTRSGVTYLISRDRVKAISRPPAVTQTAPRQIAKVAVVNSSQTTTTAQPVWIYLIGGARVEADSANESTAGVWYSRGSLNIFIERSRIERIEREDLESAAESKSSTKERGWTTGNAKIDSLIKQNGVKHGVDPYLVFCVMEQESHFSARAVSPKGARGLMQLMPGTGARFGVRNPFSPAENIAAGTRYLKQLMTQFNGRVDLVLASYNAGEGAVVKFGHRVPPYRETRDYVRRISYRYHRAKAPVARGAVPAGAPAL